MTQKYKLHLRFTKKQRFVEKQKMQRFLMHQRSKIRQNLASKKQKLTESCMKEAKTEQKKQNKAFSFKKKLIEVLREEAK